jgi:hypothetical protein
LRVESAIVLVLFKLLYCSTDKFMNNIIFCHAKYVVMNGIKKLKKLIYTNNWEFTLTTWGIAKSPRSGIFGSNLISDSYAAIFCNRKP